MVRLGVQGGEGGGSGGAGVIVAALLGGGLTAAGAHNKGASARRSIDTRLAPNPYKDGPEWPRIDIRMSRTSL